MNRLSVLHEVCLLLVRGVAVLARVWTKTQMNVVSVTAKTVSEVEDLVTIGTGVTSLVEVGCNDMFR